uniref:DUF5687 family protein n=1 Tax=Flavobacterium sp. TaxID=239 RepID=UPI00404AE08E
MVKLFLSLEWKAFTRSASFATNLALKILMAFGVLYFMVVFLILGAGLYFILDDAGFHPLETVNQFLIYYLVGDLVVRYFFQSTPVMNIRPFLMVNLKKKQIVSFTIGKTLLSFFNWIHFFILIPFTIVLLIENHDVAGTLTWFFSIAALIYLNNYINILVDKKDSVFYVVAGVFAVLGLLQYYDLFDVSVYTQPIFMSFYDAVYWVAIPFVLLFVLHRLTSQFFLKNFFLDAGLALKQEVAKTQDLSFLDKFGSLGTFLKNDIKLLTRNKRSKTTLFMSVLFIFYGLLFFTGSIEVYDGPIWRIFAGIFVSGGFLLTFGQFVPSWDSAYYPLMMSQNIKYREYLNSKWWLMVIGTAASTVIASFYLYFGWEAYMAVVVGAIFNMGVNSHLVLWAGAYVKTPIDLTTSKQAFGDKKAFNIKTMLISLPKLLLPMLIYAAGHYTVGPELGFALVALCGLVGFAFKDKVFKIIESVYKKEKYDTLAAYKQKS